MSHDPIIASKEIQETWKPVFGFESLYAISNLGQIRTVIRTRFKKPFEPLKSSPDGDGYQKVTLFDSDKKRYAIRIHRAVAEAFLGPRPEGQVVNHKDGVKTNNTISNLEYCTPAENEKHAVQMGLKAIGERNPASKLTEGDILELRKLRAEGMSFPKLGAKFGIAHQVAMGIVKRKTWRHVA